MLTNEMGWGPVNDKNWREVVILALLAGGCSFGVLWNNGPLVAAVVGAAFTAIFVAVVLALVFRYRGQR